MAQVVEHCPVNRRSCIQIPLLLKRTKKIKENGNDQEFGILTN
jgi:hypothetical protein